MRSARTTATCRRDAGSSNTRCVSTTPARSCCRRRASKRCTRRRCSARCRMRRLTVERARVTPARPHRCSLVRSARSGGDRDRVARAAPDFAEVRDGLSRLGSWLLDRNGAVLDHGRASTIACARSPGPARVDLAGAASRRSSRRGPALLRARRRRLARRHRRPDASAFRAAAPARREHDDDAGRGVLLDPALARRAARAAARSATRCGRARLERRWSKEQILEAYLNLVSFRGELQGIGAARICSPARRRPGSSIAGERRSRRAAAAPPERRTAIVARACSRAVSLQGMRCAVAMSSLPQRRVAARPPAVDSPPRSAARAAARECAAQNRGRARADDTRCQHCSGSPATLSTRQLSSLAASNVRDGAVLVATTTRGDVLAYVGSAGPSSRAREVDGVRALRQAGSTLKPFLYELAIERGYLTAASLLDDRPVAARHRDRPVHAAELRPRISRARSACARRSAARSTCRRCARSCSSASSRSATAARARLSKRSRRRRLLRLFAGARLRPK